MRTLVLDNSFDLAAGKVERQSAGLAQQGAVRLQGSGLASLGEPPVSDHDIHPAASHCQGLDIDQILAPRDQQTPCPAAPD